MKRDPVTKQHNYQTFAGYGNEPLAVTAVTEKPVSRTRTHVGTPKVTVTEASHASATLIEPEKESSLTCARARVTVTDEKTLSLGDLPDIFGVDTLYPHQVESINAAMQGDCW